MKEDKRPKLGWLGPPGNTQDLAPIATARPGKKGKWKWKEHELTRTELKAHKRFQEAMAQADKERRTDFQW